MTTHDENSFRVIATHNYGGVQVDILEGHIHAFQATYIAIPTPSNSRVFPSNFPAARIRATPSLKLSVAQRVFEAAGDHDGKGELSTEVKEGATGARVDREGTVKVTGSYALAPGVKGIIHAFDPEFPKTTDIELLVPPWNRLGDGYDAIFDAAYDEDNYVPGMTIAVSPLSISSPDLQSPQPAGARTALVAIRDFINKLNYYNDPQKKAPARIAIILPPPEGEDVREDKREEPFRLELERHFVEWFPVHIKTDIVPLSPPLPQVNNVRKAVIKPKNAALPLSLPSPKVESTAVNPKPQPLNKATFTRATRIGSGVVADTDGNSSEVPSSTGGQIHLQSRRQLSAGRPREEEDAATEKTTRSKPKTDTAASAKKTQDAARIQEAVDKTDAHLDAAEERELEHFVRLRKQFQEAISQPPETAAELTKRLAAETAEEERLQEQYLKNLAELSAIVAQEKKAKREKKAAAAKAIQTEEKNESPRTKGRNATDGVVVSASSEEEPFRVNVARQTRANAISKKGGGEKVKAAIAAPAKKPATKAKVTKASTTKPLKKTKTIRATKKYTESFQNAGTRATRAAVTSDSDSEGPVGQLQGTETRAQKAARQKRTRGVAEEKDGNNSAKRQRRN